MLIKEPKHIKYLEITRRNIYLLLNTEFKWKMCKYGKNVDHGCKEKLCFVPTDYTLLDILTRKNWQTRILSGQKWMKCIAITVHSVGLFTSAKQQKQASESKLADGPKNSLCSIHLHQEKQPNVNSTMFPSMLEMLSERCDELWWRDQGWCAECAGRRSPEGYFLWTSLTFPCIHCV